MRNMIVIRTNNNNKTIKIKIIIKIIYLIITIIARRRRTMTRKTVFVQDFGQPLKHLSEAMND